MNVVKTIIAIGGGEIKNKTTLAIDEYIAKLAKKHAGDKRATSLFIGTASHDFMPYFNSFRKIYTSLFDIKADVVMTVHKQTEFARLQEKFNKADVIYVGGGDTGFMLKHWSENGIDRLVKDAYERGVIICGLSAGAVCWFEKMYTDSELLNGGDEYKVMPALGYINGLACPHYNERREEFKNTICQLGENAVGIEDNSALVFENGKLVKVLSSGGKSYNISGISGIFKEMEIVNA